jgi:hypothetical protein
MNQKLINSLGELFKAAIPYVQDPNFPESVKLALDHVDAAMDEYIKENLHLLEKPHEQTNP